MDVLVVLADLVARARQRQGDQQRVGAEFLRLQQLLFRQPWLAECEVSAAGQDLGRELSGVALQGVLQLDQRAFGIAGIET